MAARRSQNSDDTVARYIQACRDDPVFFCTNELKIKDKSSRLVSLTPNPPQRILLEKYLDAKIKNEQLKIILLKARQWGGTTITQAMFLADIILRAPIRGCITSHSLQSVGYIYSQIYLVMLENLSPYVGLKFARRATQSLMQFNDGSYIQQFTAANQKVGHSFTFDHLHLSEVSRWGYLLNDSVRARETLVGLLNTLPSPAENSSAICVIESTAAGAGGEFHEMYVKARDGHMPGWQAVFVPYYIVPEYNLPITPAEADAELEFRHGIEKKLVEYFQPSQKEIEYLTAGVPLSALKWRREVGLAKCANSDERFAEQYPANDVEAFLTSGRPVFRASVIMSAKQHVITGRRHVVDGARIIPADTGPVEIWCQPVRGHRYVIGVDSAEGEFGSEYAGASYSAAVVLDVDDMAVVACVKTRVAPFDLARIIDVLGRHYFYALVAVEKNSPGQAVLLKLDELGYKNLYTHTIATQGQKITYEKRLGFQTTALSKGVMFARLQDLLHTSRIKIYSQELLRQMELLVYNQSGKISSAGGETYDLVMALGVAVMVMDYVPTSKPEHKTTLADAIKSVKTIHPELERKMRRQETTSQWR